ncbi:MAG: M48 family metallopeptidase [Sphingomonadaceae bacterium]
MTDAVAAHYFDGQTSRLHHVWLQVQDGCAILDGDVQRRCALRELRVSERSRHALRKVTFPDGAYLEVRDRPGFEQLLAASGQRDTLVVRWQQSWRAALLAGGATLALLVSAYLWLLPAAAGWIAASLPPALERQLGDGVLAVFDGRIFGPSTRPRARQQELTAEFGRLLPPRPGAPAWRLLFRHSRIGPNAFALPSGDIVLTDEMVALLQDDLAVMGVLAHELGHLHQRHLSRRIIQSSAIAASTSLLFGDVSSVLTNLPALALDLKYSRDAERDADDYAIAMLNQNGIPLRHLAEAFGKLRQAELLTRPDAVPGPADPYLSTHPGSVERIARIRAAQH